MADERTLGQVLHEARRASTDGRDRPWPVEEWADRHPRLQAIDEAMAAAVEAAVRRRAAAEARDRASRRWPPSFYRDELYLAADAVARGGEGQERSDGKEPG